MAVREKLLAVQAELKAPKGQTNSFGKYKYRSCEDILESVKPLLKKYNATLVISDSLELIGERYYIKATATFQDVETDGIIENTAYARESAEKKGMDDSQVTGATSSYARKYALNGLFLIDDTKDADTDEFRNQQKSKEERAFDKKVEKDNKATISAKDQQTLKAVCEKKGYKVEEIFTKPLAQLTGEEYVTALQKLGELGNKNG
jgi:hypothetical protein